MNIALSTLKLFATRLLGTVLTFFGITFFARELGAYEMGIFFLFQAVLGILAIPADFGLRGATEKRISEGQTPSQTLTTGLLLKIAFLGIIIGPILLLRGLINDYVGMDITLLLIAGLVIREMAQVMIRTLNGELRVGHTAVIIFAEKLTWIGFGSLLLFQGFGVRGVIYGLLSGYAVKFFWAMARVSTTLSSPTMTQARSLIRYAKFDAISGTGWRVFSWMDVLLIGFFLTQEFVGAYEMAWKVVSIPMLLGQTIRTSIFPQISAWDADDESDKIQNLLSQAITPALFLVIPSFFGAVLFSREILGLVFGEEYMIAWLVLIVFMAQKVVQAVNQIFGRTLQAIDHPDEAAYSMVAGIVINLLLNLLLIWQFGIIGAAIATFLSYATMTGLRVKYLSRYIEIRVPRYEVGWLILSALGMTAGLVIIERMFELTTVLRLLSVISLGGILYMILVVINPITRKKVIYNIKEIL